MDINFELYKIFYHTASSGSFSEAAGKLYISQSAVSQAIKNLEEKIGRQLFYRKTRSKKLTQEGELLYKHIEQAYNFIKTAETKLTEIQSLESGEVGIGVGDTICRYFLIPYLEKFYQKYPRIKIQVVNRTSSQILTLLRSGSIDLGIVTLPIHDEKIAVGEFMAVRDIFVASSRFDNLKGHKVKIDDLPEYPLLMLPKNSATRQNIDKYLSGKGIKVVPEIELESIDLLIEFAKIGLGIAHVLKESADAAILRGELFEVKLEEELPVRRLGIAIMSDVPPSCAANEFIQLVKSRI